MSFYLFSKYVFDWLLAFAVLLVLLPIIFVLLIASYVDTSSSPLYTQQRVGQYGRLFRIYKIRSLHGETGKASSFGSFLRRSKLDELPQLFNILKFEMSFVGPRPDIAGYYDTLLGNDRKLLELRPGLTSEASLKYRNEDFILAKQANPQEYNDKIIFPDKVKINLDYYQNRCWRIDLLLILRTLFRI